MRSSSGYYDGNPAEVLLVEEDPAARFLIEYYFEREENIQFVTAGSKSEAIKFLREKIFDAVILDSHLGDELGTELLPYAKDTPVIIMSGQGDTAASREVQELGVYSYLEKDSDFFYLEKLQIFLERAIRTNKMNKRTHSYPNWVEANPVLEFMLDGVITIDDWGIIEFVNTSAEKLFGYPKEELIGKNVNILMPEPHRSEHDRHLDRYLSTGVGKIIGMAKREVEGCRKDGTVFPLEIGVNEIFIGGKRKFIGTIRDISERKLGVLLLKEKEEKYGALYNQTPVMLHSTDPAGKIIHVSDYWLSQMGYGRDEVLGRPFTDFLSLESVKWTEGVYLPEYMKTGFVQDVPLQFVKKSGEVIDVLLSTTSEKDQVGNIRGSLSVSIDVTEKKKAEEIIGRINRELFNLISNLPGFAYRCRNDLSRTMEFVSSGIYDMIGFSPEDLVISRKVKFLELIHPDDREMVNQRVLQAVKKGRPFQMEYRIRTASGEEKWVMDHGRNSDPTATSDEYLEGIVIDVTERIHAEKSLQSSAERLKKQRDAILQLSKNQYLFSSDLETAIRSVTKLVAKTVQVDRVGVWLANRDKTCMNSLDLYELGKNDHSVSVDFFNDSFPLYFKALEDERTIVAPDAQNDPRTRELTQNYLSPLGIVSLLDVPLWKNGSLEGIVCCEHAGPIRNWTIEEQNFVVAVGNFISLGLEEREKKRAVEALKKAESRYRDLYEKAPIGYHTENSEGVIIDINETELQMLGYHPLEIVGKKTFEELISGEDRRIFRDIQSQLEEDPVDELNDITVKLIHKNGNLIPVKLNVSLVRGKNGEVFWKRVTVTDISELNRSIKNLTRKSLEIRLLHDITKTASESVTFQEAVKVCLDKLCEFGGWEIGVVYFPDSNGFLALSEIATILAPESFQDYRHIMESTIFEPWADLPERVFQSGEPDWIEDFHARENSPLAKAYKKVSVVSCCAVPILEHNKPVAVLEFFTRKKDVVDNSILGLLTDISTQLGGISEKIRVAEELKEAKRIAEMATKAKDKFISLVSHDLRSPFNSIIGYTEILRTDLENRLSDEEKQIFDHILKSCEQSLKMVGNLLDISRFQSGKIHLNPFFFQARLLVGQVVAGFDYLAKEKGIRVLNEISENFRVFADVELILEVIKNLISNAIKFCKNGDVVRIYVPENEIDQLVVEDTGAGIHPTVIPNLFSYEIKTSTQGTSGEKGNGFGLPLCKEILDLHGGRISVQSEVGKGSKFIIKIPYVQPVVLIVEDQVPDLFILEKIFRSLDVILLEAANGREALSVLAVENPHLIITDHQMPMMDGIEFLGELRKEPKSKSVPVIFLSGDSGMEIRQRVLRYGASEFVTKPIRREDLIPRIRKYIC